MIPASEMTYIVSGGALNSTHSLTPWSKKRPNYVLVFFGFQPVILRQPARIDTRSCTPHHPDMGELSVAMTQEEIECLY